MAEQGPEIRVFTVAKANSALPLVRRIVADITAEHPRWRDLVARYELLAAGARPETGETADMVALRRAVDQAAERINGYITELEQIGCQLKGFEQGLVDFYGMYQGRVVCLCWQEGEPAVGHWHELESGFTGRQPITPEFLSAEGDVVAVGARGDERGAGSAG
jgi:hypothetical protein